MVGKIKHVRQKLHQEAVKLDRSSSLKVATGSVLSLRVETPPVLDLHSGTPPLLVNNKGEKQALAESSFPTGIFAGTKITPEALVQTLKFEETPDVTIPAKKEISSIKQAQEQQAAEARRQATPVVGDLRPLADALPELCHLISPPPATAPAARRKSRKNKVPVKRPEPTDFSQMKQSQKRKLLETESSHFSNVVKTLSGKMNPLADIGEQLRKRMRQEEEQGPS
ncbi:protein FAM207A isoform X2 [Xiphias gladius]|uniref:protein FAM207A isoform X2 n=1 Tax=Xiphias gladius TaxID=8245 RepID=UPI001A9842A6|nr:protein FAM207A isoform X2 [Xiphias gladius]